MASEPENLITNSLTFGKITFLKHKSAIILSPQKATQK